MTTEEKYLEALNELYKVLKYTGKISLGNFTKQMGISHSFGTVLISGGIIKNEGTKRHPNYVWSTNIKPNIKMAEEVRKRATKYVISKKKRNNSTKKGLTVKTAPPRREINYFEGKFLGFTFRINPIYKA